MKKWAINRVGNDESRASIKAKMPALRRGSGIDVPSGIAVTGFFPRKITFQLSPTPKNGKFP